MSPITAPIFWWLGILISLSYLVAKFFYHHHHLSRWNLLAWRLATQATWAVIAFIILISMLK